MLVENGEWIIEAPDRIALEKIHGLYNYDQEQNYKIVILFLFVNKI